MVMSGLDTYFMDMNAHTLPNIATKGSFGGKKIQKFSIFRLLFWRENGVVRPRWIMFFIILERSWLARIHDLRKLVYVFLYIYFGGYWWLANSGPLYSSVCYLIWFVCFYNLLNSGVFRTLPNFQDGSLCENSWKSLTTFTKIFILRIKEGSEYASSVYKVMVIKYIACLK